MEIIVNSCKATQRSEVICCFGFLELCISKLKFPHFVVVNSSKILFVLKKKQHFLKEIESIFVILESCWGGLVHKRTPRYTAY